MAAVHDQINRPAEEDEDIILLTDVVEEPPNEVVLEIASGERELESLLGKEAAPQEAPSPTPAAEDEDLEDFLASLKDSDPAAVPPRPPESASSRELSVSQAELAEMVRREVASCLSEAQLKAIVREVIQETVEDLSRELLPRLAAEVMDRKVSGLLKRLAAEQE